jgi:glyoxylase-like metal-dependent hydrolase (beta-lactamase superfamily II)
MQPVPDGLTIQPNTGWDDRILVFQYARLVTCFALVSQRYAVLIDTLINRSNATAMLATIEEKLDHGRQLLVINTHADWDHCWGNMAFVGENPILPAPIIAHRLCRERLLGEAVREQLATMQRDEPHLYADVRLQPPTISFTDRLLIDGGDLTFELIHTPGHTPDHVAVWVPEISTLFAGDAIEAPLPFGTLPQLRTSLERLAALKPAAVFACHAPGSFSPTLLDDNLRYFNELEQRVADALAADRIPREIDDATDVEALVGYPFANVPQLFPLLPDEVAMYQTGHRDGIRAMIAFLRGST